MEFSKEDKKNINLIKTIMNYMIKEKRKVWPITIVTPTEEINIKVTMERKKK